MSQSSQLSYEMNNPDQSGLRYGGDKRGRPLSDSWSSGRFDFSDPPQGHLDTSGEIWGVWGN